MANWKFYNNAVVNIFNNSLNLNNTTAGAYKGLFLSGGYFTATDTFINNDVVTHSGGECVNYTRPSLTSISFDVTTAGKPIWKSANVAVTPSGDNFNCNVMVVFESHTNRAIVYGELGTQTITNGSTLTVDTSNGYAQADDPNT